MTSETPQRPRRILADVFHNEVTAWLVLILSLLLTAAAWLIATRYVERRALESFHYEVVDARFSIIKRMQEYEQTLRGGVALFNAAGRMVTRQEWRIYVETLDIETFFPGLQGFGYAPWVLPQARDALIAQVRAEGYPDYRIKPEGERAGYTPIVYLEPLAGRNLRAFGYDMFSEPTRRAAMERARDANQAAVSGRVVLVQETGRDVQAGFLMYLPVYQAGARLDTVEQRRAALHGYIYSPFRMKDLMQGILGQGVPELDFQIYDDKQITAEALLIDTQLAWGENNGARNTPPAYVMTEQIELPGRTWTVVFSSRENFEAEMSSKQPLIVAVGGITVDLLLFAIIWSLSQQRRRVLAKAREMTAELRHSREQFRAITETAYDAIVSTNAQGEVIYCNPAARSTFVRKLGTLVGSSVETLVPERLRDARQPGLLNVLQRARSELVHETFETIGLRADDSEFPLEVALSSWSAGGATYCTLLMRDISERKRIDRLKSEFVSTVSHELRTPLTAMRGALGLLRAMKASAPPQQSEELIGIAYQNTERLVRLVNDILDLEKLESGKLVLDRQRVALPALLQAAIDENRHYAEPQQVSLVLSQPLPDVYVWADENRLMQVLANLLSNAIKFSPAGAAVSVAAAVEGKTVRVTVTDSGSGIPEDFKERIFQRFSQADASDTRQKGGSGLGLSICKSIIDLHGGEIGYSSEAGKGSCFYFSLGVEQGEADTQA